MQTKKLLALYAFLIFSLNSDIFKSLMESWCIGFVGINFCSDEISEPFVSPWQTRNFCTKTHFIHKPSQLRIAYRFSASCPSLASRELSKVICCRLLGCPVGKMICFFRVSHYYMTLLVFLPNETSLLK